MRAKQRFEAVHSIVGLYFESEALISIDLLRFGPCAMTPDSKSGPRDAGHTTLYVAPRLNLLDQKALDVTEKFAAQPLLHGKGDLAEQGAVLANTSLFLEVIPERVLARTIPPGADGYTPRLSDIEDLPSSRCEIGVEASKLTPAFIATIEASPMYVGVYGHDV